MSRPSIPGELRSVSTKMNHAKVGLFSMNQLHGYAHNAYPNLGAVSIGVKSNVIWFMTYITTHPQLPEAVRDEFCSLHQPRWPVNG